MISIRHTSIRVKTVVPLLAMGLLALGQFVYLSGNFSLLKSELENQITQITGVVSVGLFAHRPANVLILGGDDGIHKIEI